MGTRENLGRFFSPVSEHTENCETCDATEPDRGMTCTPGQGDNGELTLGRDDVEIDDDDDGSLFAPPLVSL